VDYSSAYNDFGGFLNAPNYPNDRSFAALKADGSITAWGNSLYGGTGAPSDNGYTKIYSTEYAFAALKADGSITAGGD
jgi:alpha-tubulin suppressor-like RCC1 family protein